MNQEPKPRFFALIPLIVFLLIYLVASIIIGDFYKMPITVAFLVSSVVAVAISSGGKLHKRVDLFCRGAANSNIMLMVWIFILAGAFAQTAKAVGAVDATVNLALAVLPDNLLLAGMFIAACFISLSMGTSVGTIVALTPVAAGIAAQTDIALPYMVAIVVGGAMFGDNLSFISDTTIAACNGQGCKMTDKFKENFFIALPAAIVSVIIIFVLSVKSYNGGFVAEKYNLIQTIPYILVLIGGIVGLNVFLVLIIGVISGSVIMIATGMITPTDLLGNMGTGAAGMFETSMVAILVAAICALIKEYGGFAALLHWIKQVFKGRRGGLLGMGLLVGLMDIATANNTVAIVMANPIAKEMSKDYGISSRKAASILDTFSCVFQGILPYGAQMLVAIAAASGLGETVNAFEIMPKLFYPYMLLISSLLFIFFGKEKQK